MKPLIVRPRNKNQSLAVETLLNDMNVPFEKSDSANYKSEWEKLMEQSAKEIEEGRTHKVSIETLEDLWK